MLAPGRTSDAAEIAADIASFMRGASLEATFPDAADIDALKAALAPGTPVYLSAIPACPQEELVEQAVRVRRCRPRTGAAPCGTQLRLA